MTIGVYKIENIHNGKFYVGSSIEIEKRFSRHKRELNKNIHHCFPLQQDWLIFGEEAFLFTAFQEFDFEEPARELEQLILDIYYNQTYNMSKHAIFGDVISDHPMRENIISKMSNSLKARYDKMSTTERKTIYGRSAEKNGMYGRIHSRETKEKISQMNKGNQYAKGTIRSKKYKEHMSQIASERIGEKNPFYGKKHSSETKEKIANANKGKLPSNTKKVCIDGVVYESATLAAKDIKVATATVLNRIRSDKFPTYNFET